MLYCLIKYAEATRHMSDLVESMHNISIGHLSSGDSIPGFDDTNNSSIFVDDIELNKIINDISTQTTRLDLIAEEQFPVKLFLNHDLKIYNL